VILGIFWGTLLAVFCRTLDSQGEILSIFGEIEGFWSIRELPTSSRNIFFFVSNLVIHRSKVYKDPKKVLKREKRELSSQL
jgi:hypothetical protein